jgi:hypothetical protein
MDILLKIYNFCRFFLPSVEVLENIVYKYQFRLMEKHY